MKLLHPGQYLEFKNQQHWRVNDHSSLLHLLTSQE